MFFIYYFLIIKFRAKGSPGSHILPMQPLHAFLIANTVPEACQHIFVCHRLTKWLICDKSRHKRLTKDDEFCFIAS